MANWSSSIKGDEPLRWPGVGVVTIERVVEGSAISRVSSEHSTGNVFDVLTVIDDGGRGIQV